MRFGSRSLHSLWRRAPTPPPPAMPSVPAATVAGRVGRGLPAGQAPTASLFSLLTGEAVQWVFRPRNARGPDHYAYKVCVIQPILSRLRKADERFLRFSRIEGLSCPFTPSAELTDAFPQNRPKNIQAPPARAVQRLSQPALFLANYCHFSIIHKIKARSYPYHYIIYL